MRRPSEKPAPVIPTVMIRQRRMKRSSSFERDSEISLLWGELVIKAASNFRFLRSKGVTIRKTVDMLIGTWCIEHDVELLHNDKDFDQILSEAVLKERGFV